MPLQEADGVRSGAMLRFLGWEEGCPGGAKQGRHQRSPCGGNCSAREEGTGGAGMLGEESLRCPYVPPSLDWCVPH